MEVHHHAHPSHGKPSWKHTLFQFFMLFLAVLCGFMAEYQLEHLIENSREKQFMRSMIEDLKEDSTNIEETIAYNETRLKGLDSLCIALNKSSFTNDDLRAIYKVMKYTNFLVRANLSVRTLSQLKNSGGMRLIRKQAVSNAINAYDGFTKTNIETQGESMLYYHRLAKEEYWDIFNTTDVNLYEAKTAGLDSAAIAAIDPPKLLSEDRKVIIRFINKIEAIKGVISVYIGMLHTQYDNAKTLAELISQQYHIK